MKGILVIIDGLGDLENRQLGGKTPLEAAHTPNLDFLATRGEQGYFYTVKPNYAPGSDEAIVSIFGNDIGGLSRGQLEAYGTDLNLRKGDLAFRVNFSTIDSLEKGNVKSRRAGRTLTTKEAKELSRAINKINFPHKFDFVATNQHRAVLVIRGNFSSDITGNDMTYTKGTAQEVEKIVHCTPTKKDRKSIETAEVVNDLLFEIHEVLKKNIVNKKRVAKGLLPANFILIRGPGIERPRLKQYKNWISTNYMALEIGFSRLAGMKNYSFRYPALKGMDVYKNLWAGLRKASKHSKKVISKNLKKAEYVYVHFKETDLPGHDNKPITKKEMIEYLDKTFFKYLARIAPMKKIRVAVTGDHSTPCKLKTHSSDPVPVLLYNGSLPKEKKHFSEVDAKKGNLKKIIGKDFLKSIGFNR